MHHSTTVRKEKATKGFTESFNWTQTPQLVMSLIGYCIATQDQNNGFQFFRETKQTVTSYRSKELFAPNND